MKDALKSFILERLTASDNREQTDENSLTIGVEHELFLHSGRDTSPVDHTKSQDFLKALANYQGWGIYEELQTNLGWMVNRVSFHEDARRYTAVKYDHHPHLIEIAFSYYNSLHLLNERVCQTLETIKHAAKDVGIEIRSEPFLDLPADDQRLLSDLEAFKDLRFYRSVLLKKNGDPITTRASNYAAVIAATQTHIGGTQWWKRPNYVSHLYTLEPEVLAWTATLATQSPDQAQNLLKRRWQGYAAVFSGYPLVGYPGVEEWSLDSWVNALKESPLAGGTNDRWAARALNDFPQSPFNGWNEMMKSVRDLQIIRPQLYGTLEFRADPAQADSRTIVGIAALRLGLCAVHLNTSTSRNGFKNSKEQWWKSINEQVSKPNWAVIELAYKGLKKRGLSEEIYLDHFLSLTKAPKLPKSREPDVKLITDPRVMAGLFREALFHSRPVMMLDVDNEESELRILDVIDTNPRSIDGHKKLAFAVEARRIVTNNKQYTFKCMFPTFVASWTSSLNEGHQSYEIIFPDKIEVFEQRNSRRISSRQNGLQPLLVLVQSGGLHCEAVFNFENTAQRGLGGVLELPSAIPINLSTTIRGYSPTPTGGFVIDGTLARIQLIETSKAHDGLSKYQVGIRNRSKTPAALDTTTPLEDRRAYVRRESKLSLKLTSPLNPEYTITFEVKEASVAGFSGIPSDKNDLHLLPIGCVVLVDESDLFAEIVSADENTLHFQITNGGQQARLLWLKQISTIKSKNLYSSTSVGSDLIDLFCESGSFSTSYLRAQTQFARDFSDSFGRDTAGQAWIHRWIERSPTGEIKGHVSAVRMSDNLWHIGDIAGMIRSDRRISKDFIPAFFSGFREFCVSSSPCPKVVITWVEGHPYWKPFEDYLKGPAANLVLTRVKTNYIRIKDPKVVAHVPSDPWNFKTVQSHDYAKINSISKLTEGNDFFEISKALDFDIDRFASPQLSVLFQSSRHQFSRTFVHLTLGQRQLLLVLHKFPRGSSPSQTEDVPWAFQLTGDPLTMDETQRLVIEIQSFGLSFGFKFPGVLFSSSGKPESGLGASKKLVWTLAHPDVLRFFKETKCGT